MKITRSLLFTLFVAMILISACGARDEWNTFTVNEQLSNSSFLPYSFQYPSDWVEQSGNNNTTLASDDALLVDVPDKLKPGQIIVGISVNINMPPEEMVETYISSLTGVVEFEETVLYDLNNRPAPYAEGINSETSDQVIYIAVDMGKNMRGLVSSHMAKGASHNGKRL